MQLQLAVHFQRKPEIVTVIGERLSPFWSRQVADYARVVRKSQKKFPVPKAMKPPQNDVVVIAGRGGMFKLPGRQITPDPLSDPTRRQLRGMSLWLWRHAGNPAYALPSITEIADLRDADQELWAKFIERYGLPEWNENWVVLSSATVNPIRSLLRVPLPELRRTAQKAAILADALRVALRHRTTFEESHEELFLLFKKAIPKSMIMTRGSIPQILQPILQPQALEAALWARRIIAFAIEDALGQLEADTADGIDDRGVPDRPSIYARGCWPLVVVRRFARKNRSVSSVKCAASDCSEMVRVVRLRGAWARGEEGAHYCSEQCRQREKKRRQRARKRSSSVSRTGSD